MPSYAVPSNVTYWVIREAIYTFPGVAHVAHQATKTGKLASLFVVEVTLTRDWFDRIDAELREVGSTQVELRRHTQTETYHRLCKRLGDCVQQYGFEICPYSYEDGKLVLVTSEALTQ